MNLISKGNVKHDGKWFEEGDKISKVKKEEGQRLIDLGVAYEDGEEDTDSPNPLTTSSTDGTDTNFITPPAANDEDDEDDEDEEDEEDEDEEEEEEEETPAPTKAQIRAARKKK